METELTFGQKAVGLTFNPSGDEQVTKVKQLYAEIIDLLVADERPMSVMEGRITEVAINEAMTAQMWAVKALTWKD
jgi:hypothetical protein